MMVRRFVIHYDARGEQEHPKGDFVHWPDYQALLERAEAAERALAERAGGVKVRELLDEGLEILNGIIDNVKRRGNYSPESTCVFIDQAGQCLREALSTLTTGPAAPEGRQEAVNAVIMSARNLAREYRPSMDKEVLHSWASDAVKVIRVLSTRPSEQAVTEEWREIKQHVQPRIADGYTAVAISKPGYWFVKGPGPAAALKAAMEAGR